MSIQMNLLGGLGSSRITAQAVSVPALRVGTASATISFLANGQQTTEINSSITIVDNWVVPPSTAAEWEIRGVLASGDIPSGDALGTWLPLNVNRSWNLTAGENQIQEALLTFEFRKVGSTPAEVIINNFSLYAQGTDNR